MEEVERFRERASSAMTKISRTLRQRPTEAEAFLWEYLRDRRFEQIKFRRQHPIASTAYVVDFYCYDSRLIVELDGSIHDSLQQQVTDMVRQREIEAFGHFILRFRNTQVFEDLGTVLTLIFATHSQRLSDRFSA